MLLLPAFDHVGPLQRQTLHHRARHVGICQTVSRQGHLLQEVGLSCLSYSRFELAICFNRLPHSPRIGYSASSSVSNRRVPSGSSSTS